MIHYNCKIYILFLSLDKYINNNSKNKSNRELYILTGSYKRITYKNGMRKNRLYHFCIRYFADTLAHNENGGGTVSHNGRTGVDPTPSTPQSVTQQPPPRIPSPQITQAHPVSITCVSGTTAIPNSGAYKDPQSYVHR